MESSLFNTQSIKKEIQQSFRDVKQPGKKMLYAEFPQYEIEIKALMSKKWQNWWDIPDNVVDYHYHALSSVSPEGYKFLLPAFMTYALNNPESYSLVKEFTIYSLIPPNRFDHPDRFEWFSLRASLLNKEQIYAIILFLEHEEKTDWIAPPNDATKALEGYWRHRSSELPIDIKDCTD
jgi:hypothetical protein